MYKLNPSTAHTATFIALTLIVVIVDILLVRRAASNEAKNRWVVVAAAAAAVWLVLHAGIASSGILEGNFMPPPVMLYMVLVVGIAIGVAFSGVGTRLITIPLVALVGLHVFRIPLEIWLHELYTSGDLPVQMTWSGYNFDILTGGGALALGLVLCKRELPHWILWMWNLTGLALLITVVAIGVLSSPIPIRQFHNEPAVLFLYNAPFNWILTVLIWTALVGHLVIFRALARQRHTSA